MKALLKILFLINISNIPLIINACVIKCERKQIGFWYMVCKNNKLFQSKTPNYHWCLLIYCYVK